MRLRNQHEDIKFCIIVKLALSRSKIDHNRNQNLELTSKGIISKTPRMSWVGNSVKFLIN